MYRSGKGELIKYAFPHARAAEAAESRVKVVLG
jgi:hypothetical protein